MPMFRSFVPEKIRPWIYLCMAIFFQLSGCIYPAAIEEMMGEYSIMREDVTMCNFVTLAGMAITFPVLFRTKFRFTNKTLLTMSACGIIICNIASMYITCLPLLWIICLIDGYFKLQGTFECISNIQLWFTPTRDFTAFFPILNVIIISCISISNWITSMITYYYHWSYMNYFTIGIMLIVLLVVSSLTKHFRIMKKLPLYGIDWLGASLWSVLSIEIMFLFNYGEFYDWWNSNVICVLTCIIIITALVAVGRMISIRHPYIEPEMWKYRNYGKLLLLITITEALLATEYVLEEIFHKSVLHYNIVTVAPIYLWTVVGVIIGCSFAYIWMKVMHYNFVKLITVGIAVLALYMTIYYFLISSQINIEKFYILAVIRGCSYGILSSTFFTCLEELMTFRHFFQGLSIFNMLHMFIGGVIGSALYSFGVRYFMADNFERYSNNINHSFAFFYKDGNQQFMNRFMTDMQMISLKSIYGFVAYACIALFLVLLLHNTPIRNTLKLIPSWQKVGKSIKRFVKQQK